MSYNINLQQIADSLDFDLEDVEMLIEVFIEGANESLAQLEEGISSNDKDAIFKAAHSIKGSAGNLTLNDISSLAKDIEADAKQGLDVDYSSKFMELRKLVDGISN